MQSEVINTDVFLHDMQVNCFQGIVAGLTDNVRTLRVREMKICAGMDRLVPQ